MRTHCGGHSVRRVKAPHGGLKNATGVGHKKHAATGEGPQWAFTLCSLDFGAEHGLKTGAFFLQLPPLFINQIYYRAHQTETTVVEIRDPAFTAKHSLHLSAHIFAVGLLY